MVRWLTTSKIDTWIQVSLSSPLPKLPRNQSDRLETKSMRSSALRKKQLMVPTSTNWETHRQKWLNFQPKAKKGLLDKEWQGYNLFS